MYKIYINENPLIITDEEEIQGELYSKNTTSYESDSFVLNKEAIVQLSQKKVVLSVNKEELFRKFSAQFKFIEAAGGIVQNENGDYLFIFRRGKWDLPKGKLDKGEDTATAAIREVQEECGLKKIKIAEIATISWHIYFEKKEWVLKKTTWYHMTTLEKKIVPQKEEGITNIEWLSKLNFGKALENTYASIQDVLATIG